MEYDSQPSSPKMGRNGSGKNNSGGREGSILNPLEGIPVDRGLVATETDADGGGGKQ